MLTLDDETEIESQLVIGAIYSDRRASCVLIGTSFFNQKKATLQLRDYNVEVPEIVTESASVEVVFVPALKIWLANQQETFYFDKNLDQQIEL